MFKKVAIIGAGLMGGSLALAVKQRFPGTMVNAYGRSPRSEARLKKSGIFDEVTTDLAGLVSDSDLVVLALPVAEIIAHLKKINPLLKEKAVVMDLGSTKAEVCSAAKKILSFPRNFVGCHPLCGSEKQGVEHALADLYRGELCICIGPRRSGAAGKVAKLWQALGAKVEWMDAQAHDMITASISHLPHLVSFALAAATPAEHYPFASSGFRDMTRVAGSSPEIWADIFQSNRKNLTLAVKRQIKIMDRFISALEKGQKTKIKQLIEQSNKKAALLTAEAKRLK